MHHSLSGQSLQNFTFSKIIFWTQFQGDSGGPVVEYQKRQVHGITPILIGVIDSTGDDCSTINVSPSLISNVGFYRSWIEKKIKFWIITMEDVDDDSVYFN